MYSRNVPRGASKLFNTASPRKPVDRRISGHRMKTWMRTWNYRMVRVFIISVFVMQSKKCLIIAQFLDNDVFIQIKMWVHWGWNMQHLHVNQSCSCFYSYENLKTIIWSQLTLTEVPYFVDGCLGKQWIGLIACSVFRISFIPRKAVRNYGKYRWRSIRSLLKHVWMIFQIARKPWNTAYEFHWLKHPLLSIPFTGLKSALACTLYKMNSSRDINVNRFPNHTGRWRFSDGVW